MSNRGGVDAGFARRAEPQPVLGRVGPESALGGPEIPITGLERDGRAKLVADADADLPNKHRIGTVVARHPRHAGAAGDERLNGRGEIEIEAPVDHAAQDCGPGRQLGFDGAGHVVDRPQAAGRVPDLDRLDIDAPSGHLAFHAHRAEIVAEGAARAEPGLVFEALFRGERRVSERAAADGAGGEESVSPVETRPRLPLA